MLAQALEAEVAEYAGEAGRRLRVALDRLAWYGRSREPRPARRAGGVSRRGRRAGAGGAGIDDLLALLVRDVDRRVIGTRRAGV